VKEVRRRRSQCTPNFPAGLKRRKGSIRLRFCNIGVKPVQLEGASGIYAHEAGIHHKISGFVIDADAEIGLRLEVTNHGAVEAQEGMYLRGIMAGRTG
jgi:hypothetical protein